VKVVARKQSARERRHRSVRKKIHGTASRPRLSVFKGNRNMHCQVVDDDRGITIASASTLEKELRPAAGMTKSDAARLLGEAIAKRAKEKGINRVVFDRGGYKYHGRVKALAEAAREGGLEF